MYQVKARDIPKGKAKDKGTLIHNLCKMSNEENPLLFIAFEDLFNSQLLFVTKKGYVKQVSGIEFETNRYMVNASKLDDEDALVAVCQITQEDAIAGDRKVIMITKKGASLGFSLEEVNEFKKTSRGVKGITLAADDEVSYSAVTTPDMESMIFDGKRYLVKKIKQRKRNDKPQKAQILVK
jgi:DNA gyrase subunit A